MSDQVEEYLEISHRSEVVATRRGYTLLGLGLLVPGSAQAIHGNKNLGRFALKLWMFVLVVALVLLILSLALTKAMVGFWANGLVLKIVSVTVLALGIFWLGLAINTWWISRPKNMGAKKGAVFSVVALVMAAVLASGTAWAGAATWSAGGALSGIFSGGGNSTKDKGRYNILLLGSDSGPGRTGVRPDTIMLASVQGNTGRTVLFSLPRNLQSVPFAEGSPLRNLYPDGWKCGSDDCMLNAVYLLGEEHADLYPGVDNPGIQATMEAVSGITGLPINYYVMINMQGFKDLINAMGGLTITIHERVPINKQETEWLEAGPSQHLDGHQVLWFTRSRSTTSDYSRMERQKCVMAAVLSQMDPSTVAVKFTSMAAASQEMATTSIPPWNVSEMVDLAVQAKSLPMIAVSFTPPLINTGNPDYSYIQLVVKTTIDQSEELDAQAAMAATADPSAASTDSSAGPSNEPDDPEPTTDPTPDLVNHTDDLSLVCSVG
ncbi:MAG: LCP family protein [Propionibacteriaceae bacterium]|nr:LCP family protein [Propionibacteriaceae bacterium]